MVESTMRPHAPLAAAPEVVTAFPGGGLAEAVRLEDRASGTTMAATYVPRGGVTVVIPAKNEERNIAWVLSRLPSFVDEVILVDGDSVDRTVEVARAIRPDIRIVGQERRGKGAALQAGFAAATRDYVVMLDADGSMDPVDIAAYVEPLEAGADVVKGSRYLPGGGSRDISLLRNVGNRGLLLVGNLLYGSRFSELCYGYMAFRREALARLDLDADGFEIETQIVTRASRRGLRIEEVASFEEPRRFGTSNLHPFRDGTRVLLTLLRERFARRPGLAPVAVPAATSGATLDDGSVSIAWDPSSVTAQEFAE